MDTNFYKKSRRLKHCYKIIGKNSQIFPFIKNKAQEVVAAKIKELRKKNQGKKKLQLLILKGRWNNHLCMHQQPRWGYGQEESKYCNCGPQTS